MYLLMPGWLMQRWSAIKAYYILRAQFLTSSGIMVQNPAECLLWVVFRILAVRSSKVLLAERNGRADLVLRNGITLTQNSLPFNDLS